MATALVTGVAGQDGVYLARHLLDLGYTVVGTVRPGSSSAGRMAVYLDGVEVVEHDVRDHDGIRHLLDRHRPSEVYNLAGFTSVGASWGQPELVAEVNGVAVERLLAALADYRDRSGVDVRFLQASSAEIGPEAADSPYALGKRVAHETTVRSREERGLWCCSAMLYNHESPLRHPRFVTRKITRAAAEIACGRRESVTLGNLDVTRDWGAARDYVVAMHLMLGTELPADQTIATGVPHTLADLLTTAFDAAGLPDAWSYVAQDPQLLRPEDAPRLVGDPAPLQERLGWQPTLSFEELVTEMVRVDLLRVRTGVEEDPAYLAVTGAT